MYTALLLGTAGGCQQQNVATLTTICGCPLHPVLLHGEWWGRLHQFVLVEMKDFHYTSVCYLPVLCKYLNVNVSVMYGIKRKSHLLMAWNWYYCNHDFISTSYYGLSRYQYAFATQWPPMHGGFHRMSEISYLDSHADTSLMETYSLFHANAENIKVIGEFPAQWTSNAKNVPFNDVIMSCVIPGIWLPI